ncbi:Nitrous oxide reductase expression regulator protein [Salinisphaera shabanensis E1L3A]|uniref:Nitrous oxide reductase expression regulator protein n=1 Tax=Salinisphaera shabanensis E1L3A TaxID=1033802 RepID=U2EHC9_9GAMM|nr:NosR/NirI family protein [Salinisphaera shabanensis]ERJ17490.1 Nitrous oxide reductase expression regulator protein [Salinisphaera shabanensis E1L3A]
MRTIAQLISPLRIGFFVAVTAFVLSGTVQARTLASYLNDVEPSELIDGADAFGSIQSDPKVAPILKDDERVGYAFLNTDYSQAIGYSGKPINVVLGINERGLIQGGRLVEHHEPIVLIGIPEKRVRDFLNQYKGFDATTGTETEQAVDMVSGATVTALVMEDSLLWAANRVAVGLGLGNLEKPVGVPDQAQAKAQRHIDYEQPAEVKGWQTLVDEGAVASRRLTVGQVNEAFEALDNPEAAKRPEKGEGDDTFIELYIAQVSVPSIGLSLLGERGWNNLKNRLEEGQQAILVGGRGRYSFKGSGYVRGGIFDRIQLAHSNGTIRFHDYNHTRVSDLAPDGAPDLDEVSLFTIPERVDFDSAQPWELELLVQRATGALSKVFVRFGLDYQVPDRYLTAPPPAPEPADRAPTAGAAAAGAQPQAGVPGDSRTSELWKRIWQSKTVNIVILAVLLAVITVIFFFQEFLVRRPRLLKWTRYSVLTFVLVWLGWWANAQLSVVNIFTLTNSLLTGFSWSYFLMDPLVFILWAGLAAGMLFWARGVFCGWLCPFGALQEITNHIGRWAGIKQFKIPFAVHERLWPIKYIIFLLLFGLSLYDLALAERFAEVEPFKTAIILNFVRDWPFVIYALTLLSLGLFVERFFCRYLCPLGAALAIPARLRTFDWLKRWPECGSGCHRCARECPVQAIHPEGHIDVNECIYCLHCQELYFDDHRCPHNVTRRLKKERRRALGRRGRQASAGDDAAPAAPAPTTAPTAAPTQACEYKMRWVSPRALNLKDPT